MVIQQAREVLRIEAEGILDLIDRIGQEFVESVDIIYHAKGRVVVTGIGKSGLVGRKIVATLNSTGTPAIFLHPVEAMHGDLGMVMKDDVVLAMSNSGETTELNAIMPVIGNLGAKIIALTGDPNSTLAGYADVTLDAGVSREACPLGLAPTASTTAALAVGDALAVALIERRSFGPSDFRRLHPGGSLGERLSVQVREVMLSGDLIPAVPPETSAARALDVMDRHNLGAVLVAGPDNRLIGIFTDGDLRRTLIRHNDFRKMPINSLMTENPLSIARTCLAAEALEIMQAHEVTMLPIVDESKVLLGVVRLHDLLGKGKFRFD